MRHDLFLLQTGKKIRMQHKAKKMTLQQMSKVVGIHIAGISFIDRGAKELSYP